MRCSDANAVAAGLVRQRDLTSARPASASSSDHCALGQVLEAVREDGLAVPRVEVGLEALGRAPAEQVAVPEAEAVELAR